MSNEVDKKTSEVVAPIKEPVKTQVSLNGVLSNEVIIVNLVKEHNNGLVGKDKDGYARLENTSVEYDAPLMSNGGVSTILTPTEQRFLETYLDAGKSAGWMGTYMEEDKSVWRGPKRYRVLLTDRTLRLNLSNPIDFIKYKILLANTDDISPTYENRLDRKYLFYCQKLEDVDKNNADNIELEFKAMEIILNMGSDLNKMRNALLVIYKGDVTKISSEISIHTCKTMLRDWAMKNTRMFLEIMAGEDYKYQVMLYKGLEKGALVRRGMEYRLGYNEGELVGFSMVEALQYLKRLHTDPSAQDKYTIYIKRIS